VPRKKREHNDEGLVMNAFLQMAMVVVLLGWSLWFTLSRLLPTPMRAAQQWLSVYFTAHAWNKLGLWLRPEEKAAAGCSSGCSDCSPACSSNAGAEKTTPVQPVKWREPPTTGACH
jgi:hypothetical protein